MSDFKKAINDAGYGVLGMAMCEAAAYDYYESRFFLETINERYLPSRYGRNHEKTVEYYAKKHKKNIEDCEAFFASGWFEMLSGGVDGQRALKGLDITYEKEMRPMLQETFEIDEKRKAINYAKRYFKSILKEVHKCDL